MTPTPEHSKDASNLHVSALVKISRRYDSRRYFHERTGDPMPAYVVGEYVVEKARRDWDARPYRGSTGNPRQREWWEVRRQGFATQPGVTVGKLLFEADTRSECLRWVEAQGR